MRKRAIFMFICALLVGALFAGEPEPRQEKGHLTPKTPVQSMANVPYMTLTIYAGDDHLTASFGWLAGLPDSITVALDDTLQVTYVRRDTAAAAP